MSLFYSLEGIWKAICDNGNTDGDWMKWPQVSLPDCMTIPRIHREQLNYMVLPGITDDAHLGYQFHSDGELTLGLDRSYDWDKTVWLERVVTISPEQAQQQISLVFERTFHFSKAWIDGVSLGECRTSAAPHRYDTNHLLSAGSHRITIQINALPVDGYRGHHMMSGSGVTYNGIIGWIGLECKDQIHLENVQVYPNLKDNCLQLHCYIQNDDDCTNATLSYEVAEKETGIVVRKQQEEISLQSGKNLWNATEVLDGLSLWDEFQPALYTFTITICANAFSDSKTVPFGIREFSTQGTQITINGRKLLLRGTHEGSQFPLSGAPDMTKAGWAHICSVLKDYGMNHLRFHSWCPPEACFAAADEAGVFLQVELGGNQDTELPLILDSFGQHPSFMSLTLGNELFNHPADQAVEQDQGLLSGRWGNSEYAEHLEAHHILLWAKKYDSRHLYCCTSQPVAQNDCVDDYYVSAWSRNKMPTVGIRWTGGDVLSETRFNTKAPETASDYSKALEGVDKPLLSHEVGQWLVYPNLEEYTKYTGVLQNNNYEIMRENLRKNFLLEQAKQFTQASGQLSLLLYKEEVESALRTKDFGGFALLDLHDYQGQGIATIGIIDTFWDSKGLIEPAQFREFCAPCVPLLRLEKRCFTQNETIHASVDFSNYSSCAIEITSAQLLLCDGDTVLFSHEFNRVQSPISSLTTVGACDIALEAFPAPCAYTLTVRINDQFQNSWNIWSYPEQPTPTIDESIIVHHGFTAETADALTQGKTVLVFPDRTEVTDARMGCFTSEFWTPHNKPVPPSKTLGFLIDNASDAFAQFPTQSHSDWQWWDLAMHSLALVIDDLTYSLKPTVQVIDNFDTNQRLASLFECRVGAGKLMVCGFDCVTDLDNRPVTKQFMASLFQYMGSDSFAPKAEVTMDMLYQTLTNRKNRRNTFLDYTNFTPKFER